MTDSPALPDTPANERYVVSGARRLRCGFTTGTAAALASQAAAVLALTGRLPPEVRLLTPKGWPVAAVPVAGDRPDGQSCRPGSPGSVCAARCGIKKDAGDDPDVTDGCMVYATVTLTAGPDDGGPGAPAGQKQEEEPVTVTIEGGKGVGRVTKAGLDQKPGEAAINRVPRAQITRAVQEACEALSFTGSARVVIDVPEGEALAGRTFNPQLGIEGGISILGTSGVVEPMSEAALIETIDAELRIRRAETGTALPSAAGTAPEAGGSAGASPAPGANSRPLIITPGNYGEDFIARFPALLALSAVKCSNFVGEALDRAVLYGFSPILLVGHAGKFVKLAGGIMNTHSRSADCRMELLSLQAALRGAPKSLLERLMACTTVDAALDELDRAAGERPAAGFNAKAVMEGIIAASQRHLALRAEKAAAGAKKSPAVGVVMFTNSRGLLGMSPEAEKIIHSL